MFHLPEYHHNLSLRLSEVLDDIGINERMVLKQRKSRLLLETIETLVQDSGPVYHFGSLSEGTTTTGLRSDEDILICNPVFNVIQDYKEWKHGIINLLMIQDNVTSPGYCHLQIIRPDEPLPLTFILDEHCFRDADNRILLKNTALKNLGLTGGVYCGPAYSCTSPHGFRDFDLVYALPCKSWPYEARDWLNKPSRTWPTADMKTYAANNGCMVVPVGCKASQLEYLEWRISTSMAERCLMFNLNITQIRCYVLLKMILKTYLHHPASSFMCKTVLLHCIEDSHPSIWQENNLFKCLSWCLQVLYSSIIHQSCPHFIITGNNLMAGQFSTEVKDKLLKRLHYVLGTQGLALLGISIDDLGQRLQMKMNVMYQTVQNVQIPSAVENCLDISRELVTTLTKNINLFAYHAVRQTINHSQSYETMGQSLLQTISKYLRYYREGTALEQTAISFLAPLFCSTFGSVLASSDIGTNNSVSPEAVRWLSIGLNSDVSSGRLKMAAVFYCAGDVLRTELILQETERLYCLDVVEPICSCYDVPTDPFKATFCRVCNNKNEKAINYVCAMCTKFLPAEMNCIPHELRYELFRSTGDDLLHRDEILDNWMDWAVADSLPFLYFLQYKTYGHLHRYNDQQRALLKLVRTIITEKNLGHRETALNLLGQCMEQENRPNDALACYTTTLSVRDRNNVARYHICRLLASMLNFVPLSN